MSYNPNIPQPTDPTLQSQAQIRANFIDIDNTFDNNHFPLTGDDKFQGMHTVLTMRPQMSDPTTDVNHVAFYNKLVASVPTLFFAPNNAQTPIALTFPSVSISSSMQIVQYSFVAGPFIVYGGKISSPTSGMTIVLTPTSTLRYVGLTSINIDGVGGSPSIPINITGSQFDIFFSSGIITDELFYLAIGSP